MPSICFASLSLYHYTAVPVHYCHALHAVVLLQFYTSCFLDLSIVALQSLKIMISPDALGYTQTHWDLSVLWLSLRLRTYRDSPWFWRKHAVSESRGAYLQFEDGE